MNFLLYDGIILAVLALFVWLGWKKGLLLSLCGLAAAIVAFLGAGFFADMLEGPVADAISPRLEAAIEESIAPGYDAQGVPGAVDALREENALFAWAADAVEEAIDNADVFPDIGEVISIASQAAAQRIAHSFVFAAAFLVLYLLLILLLHVLDLVAKLPGLHFFNGLGGGLIGLVKGALVVFVLTALLMVSAYQPDPETLESSYLLDFFVQRNPVIALFNG